MAVPGSAPDDARLGAGARENAGDLRAAVAARLDAGAHAEAARLLFERGSPAEAGFLLVSALAPAMDRLADLPPEKAHLALAAAACFETAREPRLAAGLLLAAGKGAEARAALARAGIPGAEPLDVGACLAGAGAVLRRIGRAADAAPLLSRAGRHYEAGQCLADAGDRHGALGAFSRVPPRDARYREACVRVVALASELEALDLALDHTLAPFVAAGPRGPEELEAFYLLAALYERLSLDGAAREVLQRILAASPGHLDVEARLSRLGSADRVRRRAASRILDEEAAFRGTARKRAEPRPPSEPAEPAEGAAARTAVLRGPGPEPFPEPLEVQARPRGPAGAGSPFPVGAVVAGRYRLRASIGRGGTAMVYRADDLELGGEVAVKVFFAPSEGGQAEERFRREVLLARRFAHPNLLRIHDLGCDGGRPYFTMELLRGRDLRRRLCEPLSLPEALDVLVQVCAGLEAVHGAGVVHRDLKPENVFLTDAGTVKLTDFGIAKLLSSSRFTLGLSLHGTPLYMSPEQINDFGSVTPASDLYSLGVVAYEAVTGQVPFRHDELMGLLTLHLYQEPIPPRALRPDLPEALDALVLSLLRKDPSARPASAGAVAAVLREVRRLLA